MQPMNYMGMIPQPDLARSIASGFQLGAGIREMQQQRIAAQQAEQARLEYAQDVERAFESGDQRAFLRLLSKYPGQEKALSRVLEGVNAEVKDSDFAFGAEVSTALENNRPDIARARLERIIEANKNSNRPTGIFEDVLSAIDAAEETGDLSLAKGKTNFLLSLIDPEKYKKMVESGTRAGGAEAGFRPITAAERRAFGLPADVPFQISPKGEVKEIGRGPLVQVAVDTGAGFGPVPSGYERVVDPVTGRTIEREIPGGAGERARVQSEQEAMARAETITRAGQTLIRDATTAIQTIDKYGRRAAGIGSVLSRFPETAAMELQIDIDSIKGNIAIDSLLKIKESGAGLGAIPQAQLEALAGLLGSLDTRSSPAKLRANLLDIKRLYEDIVEKEGGDPFRLAAQRGFNFDAPARRTGVQQFVPSQQQPQQRQQTAPQQGGVRFLGFE